MTKTTLRGEREVSSKLLRRQTALNNLKAQLKAGTKTEKVSMLTLATTGAEQIPLEDKDIKRIEREISILKTRV